MTMLSSAINSLTHFALPETIEFPETIPANYLELLTSVENYMESVNPIIGLLVMEAKATHYRLNFCVTTVRKQRERHLPIDRPNLEELKNQLAAQVLVHIEMQKQVDLVVQYLLNAQSFIQTLQYENKYPLPKTTATILKEHVEGVSKIGQLFHSTLNLSIILADELSLIYLSVEQEELEQEVRNAESEWSFIPHPTSPIDKGLEKSAEELRQTPPPLLTSPEDLGDKSSASTDLNIDSDSASTPTTTTPLPKNPAAQQAASIGQEPTHKETKTVDTTLRSRFQRCTNWLLNEGAYEN